jgi:hypothetical protein
MSNCDPVPRDLDLAPELADFGAISRLLRSFRPWRVRTALVLAVRRISARCWAEEARVATVRAFSGNHAYTDRRLFAGQGAGCNGAQQVAKIYIHE